MDVVILLSLLSVVAGIAALLASLRERQKLGSRIDARLAEVCIDASDERMRLDGNTAHVVLDIEKWFDEEFGGLHLMRICKNPSGEYFYLNITGEAQFVKRLPPERVRLLLQGHPDVYKAEFGQH